VVEKEETEGEGTTNVAWQAGQITCIPA
jgi:hypothetical protein